jgi:hypothetical protein
MLESGEFVVAVDGTFDNVSGLRLFRFSADGVVTSTSNVIATATFATSQRLALNADGSGAIAWSQPSSNSASFRVVFQQFNSDLTFKTASPIAVTSYQEIYIPSIDLNVNGDILIAWRTYVASLPAPDSYRTFGRRFTSNGTAIDSTPLTLVSRQPISNSDEISASLRSDRGIVVAYAKTPNSADPSIQNTFVRRLNPNGTLLSERMNEAVGNASYYSDGLYLTMNDRDEYLLLRTEVFLHGGIDFDTYRYVAQKFSANDVPIISAINVFPVGQTYLYSTNFKSGSMNKDGSFTILHEPANSTRQFKTVTYGEPQDAVAGGLSLTNTTSVQFKYDIRFGNAGQMKLKFYKSADPFVVASDQVLASFDLTAASDLSKGTHTKSYSFGSGTGQVPIPGRGLAATAVDYYLLAMLDPDDLMFEIDLESISRDNQSRVLFHFNDAPIIAGTTARTYVENAVAMLVAPTATVTDADSIQSGYSDFNGGSMTLSLGPDATVDDRLTILNQGTGTGQISKSGSSVRYGGISFATMTGGTGTAPLVFAFNSSTATPAAVQALLRAITFQVLGENPSPLPRALSIALADGDGGTGSATIALNVTSVNDIPVLGGILGSASYTANAAAGVALSSNPTLVDIDNANFNFGQIRVRITTGASASNRIYFGSGASVDASNNVLVGTTVIGTLNLTGGVGTNEFIVSLNANATLSLVKTAISKIRFKTIAGSSGLRRVLFSLSDGAGTSTEKTCAVSVL